MIIFLHIPKTAGSNIRLALEEQLSLDDYCLDYSDPIMSKPKAVRWIQALYHSRKTRLIDKKIVCGHFLAAKYCRNNLHESVKRDRDFYVTFLREPLQRAVSHYYYWQRYPTPHHKLWKKYNKQGWDMEKFLLSSEMTNYQSQFLWRLSIDAFDFIGITEKFHESMSLLKAKAPFFESLEFKSQNVNPDKIKQSQYNIPVNLADRFRDANSIDYDMYERILSSIG